MYSMWQRTQHRCLVQGIFKNGKALIFLLVWNGRVKLICDIILGVFLSAELLLGSFFLQLKSHKTLLFSFINIFIIKRHIINAILSFLAETNFGQFSEPYFVLRSSKYFCFSRSEYLFFILDPLLHVNSTFADDYLMMTLNFLLSLMRNYNHNDLFVVL